MFGNGDSSGGAGQRDQIDRELDRLESVLAQLATEREIIGDLSHAVGDNPGDGALLAAQDQAVAREMQQNVEHQNTLISLRGQINQDLPGGGQLFGLGILGVLPAVAVAIGTAVAAVIAWIAYVLNAMDARRTARFNIRAGLVARGQAPASILNDEPGLLADVRSTIGTAGLWAIGILGGLYVLSSHRAR